MRGAFGLVSILIGGLIVAYLWSQDVSSVSKANKAVRPQLNQLAGKSSDGTPAFKSAVFVAVEKNAALKGLKIQSIDRTGGLFEYFGLIPNDTILRVGPFVMGDTTLSDFESARDMVVDAMQRKMDIVVNRGGTEITLPAQRNFTAPAATGSGTGTGSSAVPDGSSNP